MRTAEAQAGLQGRPGGVRGPGLHFASLQPVRAHSQVKPSRAEPAGSRRMPTTMRRSTFWCGRAFRPHPFRPAGLELLHGEERSLPGRPQGQPKGLPRPVNRICGVSTIVYKPQTSTSTVMRKVYPEGFMSMRVRPGRLRYRVRPRNPRPGPPHTRQCRHCRRSR